MPDVAEARQPKWKATTYDQLVADGLDPKTAGATYEWACTTCGARTWMSAVGGVLDWDCTCDHGPYGTDGHGITIHKMLAGVREFFGTPASIEGRKPGETSSTRLHLDECDDPDCLAWSHPDHRERYDRMHLALNHPLRRLAGDEPQA